LLEFKICLKIEKEKAENKKTENRKTEKTKKTRGKLTKPGKNQKKSKEIRPETRNGPAQSPSAHDGNAR
jgi:hypothetical protein